MKHLLFIKCFCLLLLLISVQASAFKINTHLWVGQQVINDLEDDGKLTFEIDGKILNISVDQNVVQAILQNKGAYLVGNIGPDSSPDVVVGQMTVHPGVEAEDGENIGWQSNHWLTYLMEQSSDSQIGQAYTYGFLGHAAADVFAHTYVNQYAGDRFLLFDGENLVEQRHFMLENYIGAFTPPLKDNNGNLVAEFWEAPVVDNELANFIRDKLVLESEVIQEYWKQPATYHMAALGRFRHAINAIAEDGIWEDIDILVTYLVAKYFGIDLSQEDAEQVVALGQELKDTIGQEWVDSIQEKSNEMYQEAMEIEQYGYENLSSALESMRQAESDFLNAADQLKNKVAELDSKLRQRACSISGQHITTIIGQVSELNSYLDPAGILDPLGIKEDLVDRLLSNPLDPLGIFDNNNNRPRVIENFRGTREQWVHEKTLTIVLDEYGVPTVPPFLYDDFYDEQYARIMAQYDDKLPPSGVVFTIYRTTEARKVTFPTQGIEVICQGANELVDTLRGYMMEDLTEIKQLFEDEKDQFIETIDGVRQQTLIAMDSIQTIKNSVIDFVQVMDQDVNPVQSLLKGWRDDIDTSISAYVQATSQSMINILNPDPEVDLWDPLEYWYDCYFQGLMGINLNISGCEMKESFQNILDSLDATFALLDNAATLGDMPNLTTARLLKADIETKIQEEFREYIFEEIEDMLPEEVKVIIDLVKAEPTDENLNYYFTVPENGNSNKGLILIQDMASRVKSEMKLKGGFFNETEFLPAYNSVVLAKLALLDRYGFEELSLKLGSKDYIAYSGSIDNIVAQAFGNLDGNHQWMEIPPSLPNSLDIYTPITDTYSSNRSALGEYLSEYEDNSLGLVLWKGDLRDKVFRKLFKGPVNMGIDAPEVIGHSKLTGPGYKYDACSAYGYPDSENDKTCTAIILIPVIMSLL